jgi:hypothetical protein
MNVRYMIDSIFHVGLYSHVPLLILQQNQRFFFIYFIDTPDRLFWRWWVNAGIAFLYFWIFQLSRLRNRYIIWHMEKNNILSGFHPYELLGVCLYFSVALCVPTEIILLWWPNTNGFLTSAIWTSQLIQRMSHLFLIGCIYHIGLEKTGVWALLRSHYFAQEFLT